MVAIGPPIYLDFSCNVGVTLKKTLILLVDNEKLFTLDNYLVVKGVDGPSKGVVISPGGPNLGITEGIPGPTTDPLLLGILVLFSTQQRYYTDKLI